MPSGHMNTSISLNSVDKEVRQNQKDSMNEMYASEIAKREREDEIYCICESCNKTNFFTRLKCEFCNNNVKKRQEDAKSKKSKEKDYDKTSKYHSLINLYNHLDVFRIEKSVDEEQAEKTNSWTCTKCERTNRKVFDYCEFCFSNNVNKFKKTTKKDELDKIDKNNTKLTYWDKINSYNEINSKLLASSNKNILSVKPSQSMKIEPSKKTSTVKFKEGTIAKNRYSNNSIMGNKLVIML